MRDAMRVPYAYKHLKRGPQVVLPKDMGMIIAYTGVGRNSVCVDAGTGSGWLAIGLARVCKEVVSYEIREDFIRIAEANMRATGIDNLAIRHGDVTKKIMERDVDLVVLDMADAHKAVRSAYRSLRQHGFICGYLPHMEQVKKFAAALARYGFTEPDTIEVITRQILVRDAGVRPATKGLLHTAYLTFAQKRQ